MAKADTMLAILWLLHSRGKMAANELAEELEVNIRTVYRCVDSLCASGVPVAAEIGRNGGYYIPKHVKLNPLFFSADEQKSLLHAAQFARNSGYPHEEALERAVTKLKRYARPEQLKRLERQESSLEVVYPPVESGLTATLARLEASVDAQTGLVIRYKRDYDNDAGQERALDPYGIVHWKNKWYVAGFCYLRQEIRAFRVDRIVECSAADHVFERPPGFSAREFLLNGLLSEEGGGAEAISVLVQGVPQAIDDLISHWLFGHSLVDRTADRARFRIHEHRLYTHAAYHLLSFGGKLRIEAPDELREHMAETTSSLLEYYST